jgi:hypothetical protein
MILALTVAALVGTWSCTSTDDPRVRVRYVFNADRTGSLTQVAPRNSYPVTQLFSFWITARGVFMRSSMGAALVNEDLHIRNGVLEDRGYFYQHDIEWLTPSNWEHYRCSRQHRG